MRPPSWRHGLLVRVALAFAVTAALVLSLFSVHAIVDLSSGTDATAPGSAASAAPSAPDSAPTDTPTREQPTSEQTTPAERHGTSHDAAPSARARNWPDHVPTLGRSALPRLPGAPAPVPRPHGTTGSDEPEPGGDPDPGIVPRMVNGIDVDAYVRKYSTEMGSQIRRVERRIAGAAPDSSPPGTRPKDDGRSGRDTTRRQRGDVRGIDVSGWQKNVNWQYWWRKGKRFAYVKATEGTGYRNPYFPQQYNGSRDVGMIRGAYHFALPNRSSGAAQAVYFTTHGGGWTRDGKTLPGAVDLEWNPYGNACYGKSKSGMRAWIRSFHDTYRARTGRWPVIYTSASWWNHCVGGGHGFGKTVPLWVARYSDNVGALPLGWRRYTFWQYSSDPIDQNTFNGKYARLRALANG